MANSDYRTVSDHNIIRSCFKLPKLRIPENIEESVDGYLSFKIENASGVIKVTSAGWRVGIWKCRGDISALIAAGFIQGEWCPGLPGNNKTRQAISFQTGAPRLVNGTHRGKTLPAPNIVIIRTSKNKFEVELPATKEQQKLITQARERGRERWLHEQKLTEHNKKLNKKRDVIKPIPAKYSIPIIFKESAIKYLNIGIKPALRELRGEYQFEDYGQMMICIEDQSAQDILCAIARLKETIRKAKVVCSKKQSHLSIVN